MKKQIGLAFIIDKLTNKIENVVAWNRFATEVSILSESDLKRICKNKGWRHLLMPPCPEVPSLINSMSSLWI